MIKDIKFGGYTAQPSDYDCQDGDLDMSLNLINEHGNLISVQTPTINYQLADNEKLLLIHHVKDVDYHIIQNTTGSLKALYKNSDGGYSTMTIGSATLITDCTAVGNVIMATTSGKIIFIRWDADDGNYKLHDSGLPDLDIAFTLDSEIYSEWYSSGKLDFKQSKKLDSTDEIEDPEVTAIYPENTIAFDHGSTGYIDIPEFTCKANTRYTIMVQTGLSGAYFHLYSGSADSETHAQITFGSRDKAYPFMCDQECTLHFKITSQKTTDLLNKVIPSMTTVTITESTEGDVDPDITIPSDSEKNITAMSAAVNKCIANITEKDKFIYPFFVRYALRLFDGTNINVSVPILMIPNSSTAPLLLSPDPDFLSTRQFYLRSTCFMSELMMKIRNLSTLSDWDEIVTGIDIFVSLPIRTQKQDFGGESLSFLDSSKNLESYFTLGRHKKGSIYLNENTGKVYLRHTFNNEVASLAQCRPYFIVAGNMSKKDMVEKLKSVHEFYHVAFIDSKQLSEINTAAAWHKIELIEGSLSNLATRRTLDDAVMSPDQFEKGFLETYNLRSHLYSANRYLPDAVSPSLCTSDMQPVKPHVVKIHLKTSDGDRAVVKHFTNLCSPESCHAPWYFYPDSRAYRLEIVTPADTEGTFNYRDIPLIPHDFLDGAYAVSDGIDITLSQSKLVETDPLADEVDTRDKALPSTGMIYPSYASNPFAYPESAAVFIPVDKITSLASAARALSQGQFGQFPLYAFTSEGVWALELSSTGTYLARQPITRDVCLSREGITQIDSAVLFTSGRGIMLLSGSQSECISDIINTDTPFNILTLPGMKSFYEKIYPDMDSTVFPPLAPFLDFIKTGRMIYDYVNQRIILYSPEYPYAYLFSLKSKKWSIMHSFIKYGINSYPDAFAIDGDNRLIDLSHPDKESAAIPGLLVTRPLKLDFPDILKTVDTAIQRGYFRKGHVQTILYGSRDLFNWQFIWSSKDHYLKGFRGTPYKYFRIALLCNLLPDESISGATLQFTPRLTDQPR